MVARQNRLGMIGKEEAAGAKMPRFYRFVRVVIEALLRLVTRRECVGLENLAVEPPYIVAFNHISIFDTPILLTLCRHRVMAFAADKHRTNPLYGPLLRWMGTIFVRRGRVDTRAVKDALAWLDQGGVLGVAPEGTRARGPYEMQEAKTGVAYLATRARVPVLPVGIAGTEQIKTNLPRFRRTDLRLTVGELIWLPEDSRARGEELREYTNRIMARIAELLPQEYRGFYA